MAGNNLDTKSASNANIKPSLLPRKYKDILLNLSTELITIRNKNALTPIIKRHLKDAGFDENVSIVLVDKVYKTFRAFITDKTQERCKEQDDFVSTIQRHSYLNEVFESILKANGSVHHNIKELSLQSHTPDYINTLKRSGIKVLIGTVLREHGRPIGCLFILSKAEKKFTSLQSQLFAQMGSIIGLAVANILGHHKIIQKQKEENVLIALAAAIASIQDKMQLLPFLRKQLKRNGLYTDFAISMINEDKVSVSDFVIGWSQKGCQLAEHAWESTVKHPLQDGILDLALTTKGPLLFDLEELLQRSHVPGYIRFLYEGGQRHMICMSIHHHKKSLGIFHLFSKQKQDFFPSQLLFLKGLASQLGNAITNIIASEALAERENEKALLLALAKELTIVRDQNALLQTIENKFRGLFYQTDFVIAVLNENNKTHRIYVFSSEGETKEQIRDLSFKDFPSNDGVFDVTLLSIRPIEWNIADIIRSNQVPEYITFRHKKEFKKLIGLPLQYKERKLGVLFFVSKDENAFSEKRIDVFNTLSCYVSIALSNIQAYEEIERQLKEINLCKLKLEKENSYLAAQLNNNVSGEIVGSSAKMRVVYDLVNRVARTDSTILLQGETGTGKEVIARVIHANSRLKEQVMIKVNCAALPSNLIESELFGHEPGSFTGALYQHIGKFELANNSTLFLDEVGELPMDVQVKLLRALQEKEIERIGGQSTIKTNVRIIAATNRILEEEVSKGRFRSDLFYRLNVFPIVLPPLRERLEDLPSLAYHFLSKLTQRLGKKATGFSKYAMKRMLAYDWPGNVRELEHTIERSLLLSNGNLIQNIHFPDANSNQLLLSNESSVKTLAEMEREYIVTILKKCNGRVRGIGGAALLLEIPPTTLHSKMKKLGIRKLGV